MIYRVIEGLFMVLVMVRAMVIVWVNAKVIVRAPGYSQVQSL